MPERRLREGETSVSVRTGGRGGCAPGKERRRAGRSGQARGTWSGAHRPLPHVRVRNEKRAWNTLSSLRNPSVRIAARFVNERRDGQGLVEAVSRRRAGRDRRAPVPVARRAARRELPP